MEERVHQFHSDAQRPRDPARTPKEVERLRKFLFKNQGHRFTEREQSLLFSAVQAHVAAYGGTAGGGSGGGGGASSSGGAPGGGGGGGRGSCGDDDGGENPALLLVEDALKMPFNVFGTAHKRSFLKWHAKMTGQGSGAGAAGGGAGGGGGAACRYQVIDVARGGPGGGVAVSLMADDGETVELGAGQCGGEGGEVLVGAADAFDAGEDVVLEVEGLAGAGGGGGVQVRRVA